MVQGEVRIDEAARTDGASRAKRTVAYSLAIGATCGRRSCVRHCATSATPTTDAKTEEWRAEAGSVAANNRNGSSTAKRNLHADASAIAGEIDRASSAANCCPNNGARPVMPYGQLARRAAESGAAAE